MEYQQGCLQTLPTTSRMEKRQSIYCKDKIFKAQNGNALRGVDLMNNVLA